MKARFDDTIHFNIESDADSLFLKEEVRRVANKLIGQFQNSPQSKKSSQNKLRESNKFLEIKYQSNPLHTEPGPLPTRHKSIKLPNRNHIKQIELLKKQCVQKIRKKRSEDGLVAFPKLKHKTIPVTLGTAKRKSEQLDDIVRTPTVKRSERVMLEASKSQQNFKRSQPKPPALPPPLFMRLDNGLRRTSGKGVLQQNRSTSELQQTMKKEIKLKRAVEKHKIIDKQRFIERMQRNFEARELRLKGGVQSEKQRFNKVLDAVEESVLPLELQNLELSCIEARQIESQEERALYEQLATEM